MQVNMGRPPSWQVCSIEVTSPAIRPIRPIRVKFILKKDSTMFARLEDISMSRELRERERMERERVDRERLERERERHFSNSSYNSSKSLEPVLLSLIHATLSFMVTLAAADDALPEHVLKTRSNGTNFSDCDCLLFFTANMLCGIWFHCCTHTVWTLTFNPLSPICCKKNTYAVTPPSRVDAPPLWEILDPPLVLLSLEWNWIPKWNKHSPDTDNFQSKF